MFYILHFKKYPEEQKTLIDYYKALYAILISISFNRPKYILKVFVFPVAEGFYPAHQIKHFILALWELEGNLLPKWKVRIWTMGVFSINYWLIFFQ